ncbi:MAG: hypothetical protein ABFS46_08490 [Myxococcota bacterium]
MSRRHFFAIGAFAGVTLFTQVALTRLFSVVQYYHGAFLAISLALFGFAVSGVFVFLRPEAFSRERLDGQLARYGTLLAAAIPLCFYFYLYLGVAPALTAVGLPLERGLLVVGIEYLILAVPFFASGVCISLLLQHGAAQANRLYATDLVSSAAGAVLVVPGLGLLGGPKTMLLGAAVAAAATIPFAGALGRGRFVPYAFVGAALLGLLAVPQSAFNELRLRKPALVVASEPVFWNSFSMVGVDAEERKTIYRYRSRQIIIDNSVATEMVGAGIEMEDPQWHRKDWNSVTHRLQPKAKVLIIGSGGGRDVLVALGHGHERVWAVEVNPLVVRMANEVYGDFTDHIYSHPRVETVVGDARSYIANSDGRFDIILASLIDTWAASAAGAFALTENLLYTQDAFRDYYDHLSEDGLLSVARWHPLETPRLLATGLGAWREAGVEDPRRHAALVITPPTKVQRSRVVVLLMKKSPFTPEDIETLDAFCDETRALCALTPDTVRDPLVGQGLAAWQGDGRPGGWSGLDLAPVSDERPFFFNMVRPSTQAASMLGLGTVGSPEGFQANIEATRMLVQLSLAVAILLAATVGVPLWLRAGALQGRRTGAMLGYFTCLGLGYILIEVGLIQRLILLLGKPVYSLSLILSSMLLASGIGSYVGGRPSVARVEQGLPRVLMLAGLILLVQALLLPPLIRALLGFPLLARLTASVLIVAVPAFFMGMAFPSAIRVLGAREGHALVPWVWGVNGSTSVLASVLSIVLAIEIGYTAVFLAGAACYLGAALLFRRWLAPLPAAS